MSITKEQAAKFCSPPKMAAADCGETLPAEKFQACVNALLNASVSWSGIFAEAQAIYAIVRGPGTWKDKVAAIWMLLNPSAPVPPAITEG